MQSSFKEVLDFFDPRKDPDRAIQEIQETQEFGTNFGPVNLLRVTLRGGILTCLVGTAVGEFVDKSVNPFGLIALGGLLDMVQLNVRGANAFLNKKK